MQNQKSLLIVFILIGLFVLTVTISSASAATISKTFVVLGKSYTVTVETNSEVSNLAMTPSGLGIQFQASVPSGTTGIFDVTVPAGLLGPKITVTQDGVPLAENLDYTKELIGTDYLFHLEFAGGTHTFVVEYNPPGLPSETVIAIAAIGVVATVSAVVIYALRGAIFRPPPPPLPVSGIVGVGTNVTIHPHTGVYLTFSQVKMAGEATATPVSTYPALPEGKKFVGDVFDIRTTAEFTGFVAVGLAFDGKNMSEEDKKKLIVYRNDWKSNPGWEPLPTRVDTRDNIAYATTPHLSLFGVR